MPLGPMNTKAQKREGMHTVMHEFKHGDLHSGSKTGPVVKNRKQAIAIALRQTGQSRWLGGPVGFKGYALGGPISFASGGLMGKKPNLPNLLPRLGGPMKMKGFHGFQKMEDGGFIASAVPGRTDKHNVIVDSGSYVLPADHVSALGQNNSIAGADVVNKMFAAGTKFGPRLSLPKFANGGGVNEKEVPVVVAGGEVILPPDIVRRIGNGDIEKGHSILDRWVLETRKAHIQKLKSLKPPKGADE